MCLRSKAVLGSKFILESTMAEDQCISGYEYLFNPDLLRGKVAFITGGGSGIGFTIAEIFLRHGCRVAIGSRNSEKINKAAAVLRQGTGGTCIAFQMDVRKPQDVIRAVDQTLQQFGRIDILVNAAAGNFLCPITGLSFNAYKNVLEIDTVGTFNSSKIVYEKYMQDHGGVIVNITATLYYRGQVLQAHAGSAKAAIDALTKHMAVEWGPQGVRVVGVAPGPIGNTEGLSRLAGDMADEICELIPIKRLGTRQEIAHCVLFLASSAGSLVSGETLVADGGAWLGSMPRRHQSSKL